MIQPDIIEGNPIFESVLLWRFKYDRSEMLHLYWTLLLAKVCDVACNMRWSAYTRFMTTKFEWVDIKPSTYHLKESEVALYHMGDGIYKREEDKMCLSKIVWKRIS